MLRKITIALSLFLTCQIRAAEIIPPYMLLEQIVRDARDPEKKGKIWGIDYAKIHETNRLLNTERTIAFLASIDPEKIKLKKHYHLAMTLYMAEPIQARFEFEAREIEGDEIGPGTYHYLIGIEPEDDTSAIASSVERHMADLTHDDRTTRNQAADKLRKFGPLLSNQVPTLIGLLSGEDDIPYIALRVLESIGPPAHSAIPEIIRVMGEKEDSRSNASQTLGAIGPGLAEELPSLTKLLKSPNFYTRLMAANALAKMGPVAAPAVPNLIAQLDDENMQARGAMAWALGEIGPLAAPAIPHLVARLDQTDRLVAPRIRIALPKIGSASVPALLMALDTDNPNVRSHAIETLSNCITMGAAEKTDYVEMVDALPPEIRKIAEKALRFDEAPAAPEAPPADKEIAEAKAKPDPITEEELKALLDKVENAEAASDRSDAILQLQTVTIDKTRLFPAFIDALKDEDAWVRARAARALGTIGPQAIDALPVLLEAMNDKAVAAFGVTPVPKNAVRAILDIGVVCIPKLMETVKGGKPELRVPAINALGRFAQRAEIALPLLIETVENGPDWLRAPTMHALEQIGPKALAALPILTKYLKHDQEILRVAAATAILEIYPEQAGCIEILLQAIHNHADGEIHWKARGALLRQGMAIRNDLLELLQNPDVGIQRAVIDMLYRIRSFDEETVLAMIPSLKHESVLVRTEAASYLRYMGYPARLAIPALTEAYVDRNEYLRQTIRESLVEIHRTR